MHSIAIFLNGFVSAFMSESVKRSTYTGGNTEYVIVPPVGRGNMLLPYGMISYESCITIPTMGVFVMIAIFAGPCC